MENILQPIQSVRIQDFHSSSEHPRRNGTGCLFALFLFRFMYFTNLHVLWTTGKYQATGRYISHWLITDWYGLYHLLGNHGTCSRPFLEAVCTTKVGFVSSLPVLLMSVNSQDPSDSNPSCRSFLKQRWYKLKAGPWARTKKNSPAEWQFYWISDLVQPGCICQLKSSALALGSCCWLSDQAEQLSIQKF